MVCRIKTCPEPAAPGTRTCRYHLEQAADQKRRRRAATPPGICQMPGCNEPLATKTLCPGHREQTRQRTARTSSHRAQDERIWLTPAF